MDDLTRHPMLGDKDAREELVKQTDYEELKGNLIAYAGCGDILSQGDFHSRVISQLLVNATIAISELLERAEKAERERDAAVRDLRERAIESYSECNYCLYRTARSFCSDCSDGSNWKWRGVQEE